MTEPLLTIDDATREFRVSAKTIRRRLAAGAIEGAFKRPGPRGPEWVIPRSALAAAGFAPRPRIDAKEIPDEPVEQAAYWRERALAAETALAEPGRRSESDDGVSAPLRGPGWLFVSLAVVVAAVAAALVLAGDDGDGAETTTPTDAVTATLSELTDPGDRVGVVGIDSAGYLPERRIPVQVDAAPGGDDRAEPSVPRFVVATSSPSDPAGEAAAVDALAEGARTVLAVERPAGLVRIFDRAGGDGEPTRDVDRDPASDGLGPVVEGGTGDASPPPPPAASETGSETVVVDPGESFWSIAEGRVAAQQGGEADLGAVTQYWQDLIEANSDRLVEPGNPDVLHVGQQLRLPPAP